MIYPVQHPIVDIEETVIRNGKMYKQVSGYEHILLEKDKKYPLLRSKKLFLDHSENKKDQIPRIYREYKYYLPKHDKETEQGFHPSDLVRYPWMIATYNGPLFRYSLVTHELIKKEDGSYNVELASFQQKKNNGLKYVYVKSYDEPYKKVITGRYIFNQVKQKVSEYSSSIKDLKNQSFPRVQKIYNRFLNLGR